MGNDAIILTPHQSQLMAMGVEYLADSSHRRLLIEGSAGTGKTTLIAYIIKALKEELERREGRTYSAVMTAPTNKAVEVLRSKSNGSNDIYSIYCTLHSALKLRYKINEETGQEEFVPDPSAKEDKLRGTTLLVVDEASMIGETLLGHVEDALERNEQLKVIYLGDIKQLPPVNEHISPIFTKGYERLELKEIIRQAAENPIIPLSNNIYQLNSFVDETNADGLGYAFTKDRMRIIRYFAKHREDLGVRFLGYTNRCVEAFNNEVRREIFHDPKRIEVGETIIFDRPYETIDEDEYGNKYQRVYTNNEEVLIDQLDIAEEDVKIPWDKDGGTNKIRLKYYMVNDSFPILHEESGFLFADLLETLRRRAINRDLFWRDFFRVRDAFVAFKHRYALTVHKAQGSTYREVFMDYDDMLINQKPHEREKLLYTAITRASKHLTIITNRLRDGR